MRPVQRQLLAAEVRAFGRTSREMAALQRAMDLLHPTARPLPIDDLVTLVLYSAMHSHEARTRSVLHRLNEALARTMDDLDALRRGEPLGGRTAGMRAADLTTIAEAMHELPNFEKRVRDLLDTDPDGMWAQALRAELAAALTPPQPPRPVRTAPPPTAPRAPRAAVAPLSVGEATTALRDALWAAGPSATALWNARTLPRAVSRAAHRLVIAAGGDVGEAVRRLVDAGGPDADAMVVAVLWREGRIEPQGVDLGERAFEIHQRLVTGLEFEWHGELPPGVFGKHIGIDGIADGFVVDAKHLDAPLETSPHVLGEAAPRPTPFWRRDTEVDVLTELGDVARAQERLTPESRGAQERLIVEHERDVLEQMERQLEFARHNGLKGIRWVCNDEGLAEAFRTLAHRLPATYADLQVDFVVGGLVGSTR